MNELGDGGGPGGKVCVCGRAILFNSPINGHFLLFRPGLLRTLGRSALSFVLNFTLIIVTKPIGGPPPPLPFLAPFQQAGAVRCFCEDGCCRGAGRAGVHLLPG